MKNLYNYKPTLESGCRIYLSANISQLKTEKNFQLAYLKVSTVFAI